MQQLRSQRGFTLVELLVAMLMSTVVIGGATTMMISTMDATQEVSQRATALGEARTGIETLLGQLNSGCLLDGVSPVLASTTSGITPAVNSNASDLVFVSGDGDSATATPTEHVVNVNSSGALIDSAYSYTGTTASIATPSAWTFATTPSQVLNLAENVTTGSGPMFSYYAYSSQTGTDSLMGAPAMSTPLTSATAPTVAEVGLDFRFGPPGTDYKAGATSELQDSAVFSLTAQNNVNQNAPCQ